MLMPKRHVALLAMLFKHAMGCSLYRFRKIFRQASRFEKTSTFRIRLATPKLVKGENLQLDFVQPRGGEHPAEFAWLLVKAERDAIEA